MRKEINIETLEILEFEDAPVVEQTQEEIILNKIIESNKYLKDTDWVKDYILRHDLGVDILPSNSNKLAINEKRKEYIKFLKEIDGM